MSRRKDVNDIYQSLRWRELREAKLDANPVCELCEKAGRVTPATLVHHRIPIETALTRAGMEELAYRWSNLQSLCRPCHSDIHQRMRSRSREGHKAAASAHLERWVKAHQDQKQEPHTDG